MAMHGAQQELAAPAETVTSVSPADTNARSGGSRRRWVVMKGGVWEAPRHLRKAGQRVFGEIDAGSVVTAAEVQREFGLGGRCVVGLKKPLVQCDPPLKTSTARSLIQLLSAFGRTFL